MFPCGDPNRGWHLLNAMAGQAANAEAINQAKDQNVFSDGSTKVDYVLVWEESLDAQEDETIVTHKQWRETFLGKLQDAGLVMEKPCRLTTVTWRRASEEVGVSETFEQSEVEHLNSRLCFVLLSAPWKVLCYYAEEISLRAPLQIENSNNLNWSGKVLQRFSIPNLLRNQVPLTPPDYYTCQFRANKVDRFLGSDDRDNFFKPTQRHRVLYEILSLTPYGSEREGQVGISGLIKDQVFSAAYPLHQERPRPEFAATAPLTTKNPVTGLEEPYFPSSTRNNRTLTGCSVLIIMIAVVLICLTAIILYRSVVTVVIYTSTTGLVSTAARAIASFTGSLLNLVVIMILSKGYTNLAYILTSWEMHRTQTEFEDMYTLKVFIFQFVNFYSSPVYIAFFKGRFVGVPGDYNSIFGVRIEDCGSGGCLIELAQELLVIMVGKQTINNIQEIVSPKLFAWWRNRGLRKAQDEEQKQEVTPWERDFYLLPCEGLFDEYLEIVLQFGFITVFVAACPLAPLFALLNNWVEIRLDAQKFLCEFRRAVVEPAPDIGIWFPILNFIAHTAVIANAFLIAFTSTFLERTYFEFTRDSSLRGFANFTLSMSPKHQDTTCMYRDMRDVNGDHRPEYFQLLAARLTFVVVFVHVVFIVGCLIDVLVPDVPEDVEIKIKREQFMAKKALAENQAFSANMNPLPKEDCREPPCAPAAVGPKVEARAGLFTQLIRL
uniref:Anoctamin n=1 Tax=Knipowitschia caucasica TaxID=637954 RepID=A0AAV2K1N8_KNICA